MKKSATARRTLPDGTELVVYADAVITRGYGQEGVVYVEAFSDAPGVPVTPTAWPSSRVKLVRQDDLGFQYEPTRWQFASYGNFQTLDEGLKVVVDAVMSGTLITMAVREAEAHGHPAWSHYWGHGPCTQPSLWTAPRVPATV